jgi:hypothetical protein
MLSGDAPEVPLGVQAARLLSVVWAFDWIAERALCAVDRLVETALLPVVSV